MTDTPSPDRSRRTRGGALGPEHWDMLNAANGHPPRAGTSALDVLTPAPEPAAETEPDAISRLLAQVDQDPDALTPEDAEKFRKLDRWKRAKATHEASAKTLGRDIAALTAELLELRLDREWGPKIPALTDDNGEVIKPFTRATIYPKFRDDPETGDQYDRGDVVRILHDVGLAHLIEPSYDTRAFTAAVSKAVKAWRHQIGETPAVDDAGQPLDALGNRLHGDEADDPTDDALALHPLLRALITPVTTEEIQFSRR